jgi:MFS family permease
MATNAAGFLPRVLPGYLADRYSGPLNAMLPAVLLSALALFLWAAVPATPDPNAAAATWAWAVAYGSAAATILGLFPAALAALAPDARRRGARMGMGFAVAGVASLVGPPVGGLLVKRGGGHSGFLYAQMWAGAIMVAGLVVLAAARISLTGCVLRSKV